MQRSTQLARIFTVMGKTHASNVFTGLRMRRVRLDAFCELCYPPFISIMRGGETHTHTQKKKENPLQRSTAMR